MPPYTRRSSGWTANGSETPGREAGGGPGPNIEYFLEHLEQFKRKHISQNRDIIKSNAHLQLGIRDLESQIQQLKVERHRDHRLITMLRAEMYQMSQRPSISARDIWLELGKNMGFTSEGADKSQQKRMAAVPPMPSKWVAVDPSNLPEGVTRSVAKAPDIDEIFEETEEEEDGHKDTDMEMEMDEGGHVHQDAPEERVSQAQPNQSGPSHPKTYAPPQPPHGQRLASSSALEPQRPKTQWTSFLPATSSGDMSSSTTSKPKKSEAMKGKKVTASTSTSHQGSSQGAKHIGVRSVSSGGSGEQPSKIKPKISESRPMPEPTMDAIMEPVVNNAQEPPNASSRLRHLNSNNPSNPQQITSTSANKVIVPLDDQPPPPIAPRKRKPSSARDQPSYNDASPSTSPPLLDTAVDVYDTALDEGEAPTGSRSSRRSSVRARPSINYALPKLNTKMRKPDPEEGRTSSLVTLTAPPAPVGTGEGDTNGDLKDLKKERQMRQGRATTTSARKSTAPRSKKSRASKSSIRSQAHQESTSTESEDEDGDGKYDQERWSVPTSEVGSSADEYEETTAPSRRSVQRPSSAGSRNRTASNTPASAHEDSDEEGEETIIAVPVSVPATTGSNSAARSTSAKLPSAPHLSDTEEEIEVARSACDRADQRDQDDSSRLLGFRSGGKGDAKLNIANQEALSNLSINDVTLSISQRSSTASYVPSIATTKRPFTPVTANSASNASTAAPPTRNLSDKVVGRSETATSNHHRTSSDREGMNGRSTAGQTQIAAAHAPISSSDATTTSSSSSLASRPSLSSSSSSSFAKPRSVSIQRPTLTEADLALLASSTSSLADLTSTSLWPSTPQIGSRGMGTKGSTTSKKVSTLSRFSAASASASASHPSFGGAMAAKSTVGGGGNVAVGGAAAAQQRVLPKMKPFSLSVTSSLNANANGNGNGITSSSTGGMASMTKGIPGISTSSHSTSTTTATKTFSSAKMASLDIGFGSGNENLSP